MLGSRVLNTLSQGQFEIYGSGRKSSEILSDDHMFIGDLTDPVVLKNICQVDFDIIIHCVANVNLNDCEVNRDYTYELHVSATRFLASAFSEATFIYISTDSVYDGDSSNYTELHPVYPKNYYAFSKFEGECASLISNPNAIILRTNFYGFSYPTGKSLFEWAVGELQSGNEVSGFSNVIFTPLYVGQLADLIFAICMNPPESGIYNAGGDKALSKFEFIQEIAAQFGFNIDQVKSTISTPDMFPIRRPDNTSMDISKIKKYFPAEMFSYTKGFDELHADFNPKSE